MIERPHFETEREYADWIDENRHLIEEAFITKLQSGAKLKPGRYAIRQAALCGITPEQWMAEKRAEYDADRQQEAHPVTLAKLPRSA